jgi:hypothetical protein
MTSGRRDEQYVGRSDKPPENCTVVLVAAHVRFARCRALRAQHYLADAANVWCGEPHRSTSSRAPRSASGRVVSIMLLDRKGGQPTFAAGVSRSSCQVGSRHSHHAELGLGAAPPQGGFEPNSIALSAPSEVLEEREADLRRVRELPFHDLKS